jgi:hypothetical protein
LHANPQRRFSFLWPFSKTLLPKPSHDTHPLLLQLYSRANNTRLWQKTAHPTLAA